jgi:hypothetical protein
LPITYNQTGVTYDSTTYTYDGEVYSPSVFPVAGVFIAWNDGPYVANPGWTEITPYVREISIRRGRADDLEQFDTGTAQLVLDNRARTFDPFYTSGPYYLKLTPRRQIKIVAQIGGVNYDVFRGYVAGWPVTWSEAGFDSTVTIQAFDALGLMANETIPSDWLTEYTTTLNPILYWPCRDTRPQQTIRETVVGGDLYATTSPAVYFYEQDTQLPGVLSSLLFCTQYYGGRYLDNATWSYQDFAQAGVVQYVANATGSFVKAGYAEVTYSAATVTLLYQYDDAGGYTANTLRVSLFEQTSPATGGRNKVWSAAYAITPAQQIHYAINYTASTKSVELYINGTPITLTLVSDVAATSTATGPAFSSVSVNDMAIAQLAFYPRKLTTTEISNLYNFAAARVSETTTARMNRLIGQTSFPTLLTSFTSTPVASVAEIGSGAGIIPEMQIVADSEGGEIYVSKSGILTTTNRTDVFNATRSANVQATLTDSGAGLKYGTEVTIEYDGDGLKNDVTIVMGGSGEVNVTSAAIISAYGGSSTTIETQLSDPYSAAQLALMELGVEGSLVPRITPLDVSANTAAADWQTILGLELLDRVTFKRTPSIGNQFSRDALVNAIEHQIVPGVWRTQLTLSMRYTSPMTADDDVLGTADFNYAG